MSDPNTAHFFIPEDPKEAALRNPKIRHILQKGPEMFAALVKEGAAEIVEAMRIMSEEAATQDKPPRFKLAFGVTIEVDEDGVVYDLNYGLRRKLSAVTHIDDSEVPKADPNQAEMFDMRRFPGPPPEERP